MPTDRFADAMARIDVANAQDPAVERHEGSDYPRELLYSHRMSQVLEQFAPDAPEELKLAARAQHIRRWEIPRDSYAPGRVGYLKWRTDLGRFHADVTEAIMRQAGYDEPNIQRVRDLLMKKHIKADPQMQTLEDVICLVFLRHYFEEFAAEHPDDKVVHILRRTWKKMSERGHAAALKLPLSPRAARLVETAISASEPSNAAQPQPDE